MKLKRQEGIATVEMAIVLPILLLILFGIIEFSLILFDKAMITNASREGARAGVVFRANPTTGEYSPYTDAEITAVVNNYLGTHLISPGAPASATIVISRSGGSPGGELRVRVSYPYDFLVLPGLVSALLGLDPLLLVAETIMRME